jgi:uncharacterized protein YodC (DUF2158 family)
MTVSKVSIMKWKIGDTVQLNSGSPPMTVTGFSPRGKVWVEWKTAHLVSTDVFQEASFHPDTLTRVQCEGEQS